MKKKVIPILVATAMLSTMMVGCAKDIDKPAEPEEKEEITAPTEQTPTEEQPTVEAPEGELEPVKKMLKIKELKPTGTIVNIQDVDLQNGKTIFTSFKDIDKVEGGIYSYTSEYIGREAKTWDEIKDVKIEEITPSGTTGNYTIALSRPSTAIQGAYLSLFVCVFDVEDKTMTVEEAYDAGMYYYLLISDFDEEEFSAFEFSLNGGAEAMSTVECMMNKIGVPTAVYYHDFGNHITFDMLYELEDRVIVLSGYEKMEDYENDADRLVLQSISVYGKGSTEYTSLITETDSRIMLK